LGKLQFESGLSFQIPNGFLVAIEGIDGTGKSTQARLLAEALARRGFAVVQSREPTAGTWGKLIRESAARGRKPPAEELELFIKDRQEHVANLIGPGLAAGKFVVLDRYYFSTAAYQGARGLDPDKILRQNEAFAPPPDLLVLIDLEASRVPARIQGRGLPQTDHFESRESIESARRIFNEIRRPYLARIDGTLSVGAIQRQIVDLVISGAIEKITQLKDRDAAQPLIAALQNPG
jgi:dTMP kinase